MRAGDRIDFLPCNGTEVPELTLHARYFLPEDDIQGDEDQSARFSLLQLIREFRYALDQVSASRSSYSVLVFTVSVAA